MAKEQTAIRALVYSRLSKADVLPDGTPDAEAVTRQERTCRAYCEQRGWTVAETVTDNDFGASRYSRKVRPGWQRVLDAMKGHETDVVVAYHLDRITRSPRDIEDLIDICEATGVGIATTNGTLDLTTDDGRAMARVGGAFAAHYSDATSRRMRAQRRDRAQKGDPVVAVEGFGWRDGLPVPEEADAIRDAAVAVVGGASLASIARRWNAAGLKRRRTDQPWRSQDVRVVLRNKRHRGESVYRGETVGDLDAPRILDEQTAAALVSVLEDPDRRRAPRKRRMLSGVVRCGRCGSTMRRGGFGSPRRDGWVCDVGTGGCGVGISAEPVERDVEEAVLRVFDTGLPAPEHVVDPEAMATVRQIDAEAKELGDAYGKGLVPMAAFLAASKALEERRTAAVAALAPRRAAAALGPYREPGALRKAWPSMPEDDRNVVMRAVLEAVVVSPAPYRGWRGDPTDRVEVRWAA